MRAATPRRHPGGGPRGDRWTGVLVGGGGVWQPFMANCRPAPVKVIERERTADIADIADGPVAEVFSSGASGPSVVKTLALDRKLRQPGGARS